MATKIEKFFDNSHQNGEIKIIFAKIEIFRKLRQIRYVFENFHQNRDFT